MNKSYLNRYLPFLMKSPLFCLFWTLFGWFLDTFPIRPVSMIPWLLNWIIFWIESADFFFNWIIFWIESWVKQYWIKYWMNRFLSKFKHWIESDRVSNTPNKMWLEIWNRFFEMKENYASPRTSWQYYARRWLMPSQVRSLQGTHNAARRVLDSVTSISGSVSEVTFFLGVVL